jgi:hypothetical protein
MKPSGPSLARSPPSPRPLAPARMGRLRAAAPRSPLPRLGPSPTSPARARCRGSLHCVWLTPRVHLSGPPSSFPRRRPISFHRFTDRIFPPKSFFPCLERLRAI